MATLAEWVTVSTGGESLRTIATRLNRSPDSLSRWLRRQKMPAEVIIQLSRVYHADLLAGALSGGVISDEDVDRAMPNLLRQASLVQLTAEVHRRATERTFRTLAS
jgi:IS30 family transposase